MSFLSTVRHGLEAVESHVANLVVSTGSPASFGETAKALQRKVGELRKEFPGVDHLVSRELQARFPNGQKDLNEAREAWSVLKPMYEAYRANRKSS